MAVPFLAIAGALLRLADSGLSQAGMQDATPPQCSALQASLEELLEQLPARMSQHLCHAGLGAAWVEVMVGPAKP